MSFETLYGGQFTLSTQLIILNYPVIRSVPVFCLFVGLSICISTRLSVCCSVCLSVCQYVCLNFPKSICLFACWPCQSASQLVSVISQSAFSVCKSDTLTNHTFRTIKVLALVPDRQTDQEQVMEALAETGE